MFEELKKILGDKIDRVGVLGPSFLALSTIISGFVSSRPSENLPEVIQTFFVGSAWTFFAFGVLIICLRLVSHVFVTRPAKGLIDGMAAGVVAGLLGGYLGYAGASEFEIAGFEPVESISSWSRMLTVLMFSIPFGGFVGMCLDFAHPVNEFQFRNYVGPLILGFFSTATCLGFIVAYFAPIKEGGGIQFWHLQIIAEVYIFCFLGIVILEQNLESRQILRLVVTVGLSIIAWRIFASLLYLEHPYQPVFPNETLQKIPLSQYFGVFFFEQPDGQERFTEAHIATTLKLLIMCSFPIIWILSTYFFAWRLVLRFKFSSFIK